MIVHAVLFEQFVGRDAELEYLAGLRARAARGEGGGTISIIGEAGVGKSRLLTEFAAATRSERGPFVRVRCDEVPVSDAPLLAALQALSSLRDLRRSDAAYAAIEDVRRRLTSTEPANAVDPNGRKYDLLRLLTSTLGLVAQRLGQLTLVVDDVHWSDISTLEALKVLAREIDAFPIVLVLAYRADDLAGDHARAAAVAAIERERADRMILERLSYGDVASLLRRQIPNANEAMLRRIYDLSEGRPFVVEELTRSIVERGTAADLEATLSLRSAVLERFERLAPGERDIIERAAVLGRNFAPGDLEALGASRPELFAALRAGVALQLLEEREIAGTEWFRFRHAITREILYRNLLAVERRALHLQIADSLESRPGRIVEFAYHAGAAGDRQRAGDANERAGDRACELLAFADAAKLYARALDFTSHDKAVARIGRKLVDALTRAGDTDGLLAAGPPIAERLVAAGLIDDALHLFSTLTRGIHQYHPAEGASLLDRANALVSDATSPDIRFDLDLTNCRVLRTSGRVLEAIEACTRAEGRLECPTSSQRNAVLDQKAVNALHRVDTETALAMLETQLSVYRGSGTLEEISTLGALARTVRMKLRFRDSFNYFLETIALCERLGHYGEANVERGNAASLAANIGNFAFVRDVAERFRRDGTPHYAFLDIALLNTVRATGGDPAPFVDLFERSYRDHERLRSLAFDLAAVLEDRNQARSIARRALEATTEWNNALYYCRPLVDVGNDDDVAYAIARYRAALAADGFTDNSIGVVMLEAAIADRQHRSLEARALGKRAVELARGLESWFLVYRAHELAHDFATARATLVRVGATAELARFDRRHPSLAPVALAPAARLTRREEQIARSYANGASSREVAERLAIGPRTVETHLLKIYQKLGISSRGELAEHFAQ